MSRYDRRSGTCNLSNCKVTRKKNYIQLKKRNEIKTSEVKGTTTTTTTDQSSVHSPLIRIHKELTGKLSFSDSLSFLNKCAR